ncbi:MAG: efflux RND transporter periplasmic adaptor subunit [Nitrospiraceae bacterium]|nr:efflux RND transporter periplasmic adaptor subunit [Nitrospiraceae bacterium]
MKKGHLIVIAAVAIAAGLIFSLSNSGFGQKNKKTVPRAQVSPGPQAAPAEKAKNAAPQDTAVDEEEEVPTIEISSDKQQLIGVKTVEVKVRPLTEVIRTVGIVDYDERRLSTVNTKFEGWIEKLYVDYNGKYVKKGEPLAEIYSPELVATQQEFINVLKWAGQGKASDVKYEGMTGMLKGDADALVEAAKQRLRLWDISEAQIKKIEETGKPVRTLTVYSPANGYVVQKAALQGMKVMPGEKLFDLADLSTLWIIADFYEYELSLVKPGERATISLSYFPGKEFSSRIDYVYPTISGQTRTAKVRFEVPNFGGRLKPQMYTNVEVKIGLGKKLSVPDNAVIDTGTRQIVYVDRGEGNFEPREVLLGVRAEGMAEVLKGLKAGEKVASAATFLIDSEAQLQGVVPLSGHKH